MSSIFDLEHRVLFLFSVLRPGTSCIVATSKAVWCTVLKRKPSRFCVDLFDLFDFYFPVAFN